MSNKIGILTYFWAHNPGTFLQAYAMVRAVQEAFPDYRVELINCRFRKVGFQFRKLHIIPSCFLHDVRHFRAYCKLQDKCLPKSPGALITLDYDTMTDYIRKQDYRMIIVGADQILKFWPIHLEAGQVPIYWLPPEITCKKAMFAASSAAMTLDSLDDKYRTVLKDSANAFDLLGVRDDNTYDLVEAVGLADESKLEMTPDPTFPLDIDYGHADRLLEKKHVRFDKPTVAIQLPEQLPICRKLIAHYQSNGFRVVLLERSSIRRDVRFPAMSPLEWAGVHRNFALEITDRFHGTVFSLKNRIPVVVIDWEKRKWTDQGVSKTYSLLKLFDLHESNHINAEKVTDAEEVLRITDAAMANHDPQPIAERDKELRSDFYAFMEKVKALLD